jgi:hypothetical protein
MHKTVYILGAFLASAHLMTASTNRRRDPAIPPAVTNSSSSVNVIIVSHVDVRPANPIDSVRTHGIPLRDVVGEDDYLNPDRKKCVCLVQ